MADDEHSRYRASLEALVAAARKQLSPSDQDRIRQAIRRHREDRDSAVQMLLTNAAEHFGIPILDMLDEAERELGDVADLEKIVTEGLAPEPY